MKLEASTIRQIRLVRALITLGHVVRVELLLKRTQLMAYDIATGD
jgi:hypothetical protein